MPELRLVVLALQDRLAYGPTFESALAALFGGAASTMSAFSASPAALPASSASPPPMSASPPSPAALPASSASPQPTADLNTLIGEAAKDFADYQRLTAEGKL